MDGNRRWAREKSIPTFEGHKAGAKKIEEVILWAQEASVRFLIIYAFSTENWNRPEKEVSYLMDIFRKFIKQRYKKSQKDNTKVRFIGQIERLPKDVARNIRTIERETENATGLNLVIALSYGGRAELIRAFQKLREENTYNITEEMVSNCLWTKDIPDPDLIIRTSGEMRLSNFLPWQGVYSELFFTKTYWPALSKEEFKSILTGYSLREQRRGT